MLQDLSFRIKPEYVDARPFAVTGPLLITMQDDLVTIGNDSLEVNPLFRILSRHALEIFDERFLAVPDPRIVLNVSLARIAFDCFSWLRLIEHQVIKLGLILFIPIESSS